MKHVDFEKCKTNIQKNKYWNPDECAFLFKLRGVAFGPTPPTGKADNSGIYEDYRGVEK